MKKMHPKLIVLALACAFSAAHAAPTGGVFALGTGTITGTTNVLVNSTDAAAKASLINWASFNVGAGESVDFNAINPAGHAFFNVDASGSRSMIFGSISTSSPDTSVYVVNPNGVTLGGNALVNVSGTFGAVTGYAAPDGTGGVTLSYENQSVVIDDAVVINADNVVLRGGNVDITGSQINATGKIDITSESSSVRIGAGYTPGAGQIHATNELTINAATSADIASTVSSDKSVSISASGVTLDSGVIDAPDITINASGNYGGGVAFYGDSIVNGVGQVLINSDQSIITPGTSTAIRGADVLINSANGDVTLERTVAEASNSFEARANGTLAIQEATQINADSIVAFSSNTVNIHTSTLEADTVTIQSTSSYGGGVYFRESPTIIGGDVFVLSNTAITGTGADALEISGRNISFQSDDNVSLDLTHIAASGVVDIYGKYSVSIGNNSLIESTDSAHTIYLNGPDVVYYENDQGQTHQLANNNHVVSGFVFDAENADIQSSNVYEAPAGNASIKISSDSSVGLSKGATLKALLDPVVEPPVVEPPVVPPVEPPVVEPPVVPPVEPPVVEPPVVPPVEPPVVEPPVVPPVEPPVVEPPVVPPVEPPVVEPPVVPPVEPPVVEPPVVPPVEPPVVEPPVVPPVEPPPVVVPPVEPPVVEPPVVPPVEPPVVEPPVVPPVEPPVVEPPVVPPVEPPVVEPPVVPPVEPPVVEPPVVPPIVPPVVAPEATPETIAPVVVLTNMVVKQDTDISSPTVRANEILIPAQNLGATNVSYSSDSVVIEGTKE